MCSILKWVFYFFKDTTLALWFPCILLSALESGLSVWCFIVGLTLRGIGPCGHTYLREQVNHAYSQQITITCTEEDLYIFLKMPTSASELFFPVMDFLMLNNPLFDILFLLSLSHCLLILHGSWKKTPWHIHQRGIQNFQPRANDLLLTVLPSHEKKDQSEI